MGWLLLDLALVLLVLVVLAVVGLRLYRAVRALLRRLGAASEAVDRAGAGLSAPVPSSAGRPADASRRLP